jgi:hypothetical protein
MPDENPASTTTTTSASSPSLKPTAPPPVSDPASPATPAGGPTLAGEYASQPEVVTAVQYVAPDGEVEGNLDEVAALGVEVTKQEPWDPAGGQDCILIGYPAAEGDLPVRFLVQPGQYVVVRSGANAFEVYEAAEFTTLYSPK